MAARRRPSRKRPHATNDDGTAGQVSAPDGRINGSGILARYATVLDAIAARPEGLILAEIMRATGLPQGTVHRLINALLKVGYIERRENRKIYVVGNRLMRLLYLRLPRATLADLARPVLDKLAQHFGETAFLAKLDMETVESVATVMPAGDRRAHVQPGRIMPLHAAASAKAIFAFQSGDVLTRALAVERDAFTPKTLTRRKDVLAEFEQVRRTGYASCLDELDPGVASYACPVRIGDTVIYSVGLVGIAQSVERFPVRTIVGALREAADRLSALLSGATAPSVEAMAGADEALLR
jgi:DNA-binding IclR family transcriptional regulator